MTEDKKVTRSSADSPVKPEQPAPASRTEARRTHAAAAAEAATEQNKLARSRRRAAKDAEGQEQTEHQHAADGSEEARPVRWVQIRILPIYVRVLIVIALLALAVVSGAMIGYSILGDGTAAEVFHKETWTHIFDIMNGKE